MKDNCPAVLAILGKTRGGKNKSSPTIRGSVERNREMLSRLPLREPPGTFPVVVIPE